MAPLRTFLAVPTDMLLLDATTSAGAPKLSPVQLNRIVQKVPQIYGLLNSRSGRETLGRLRVDEDPLLWETYRDLFTDSPSANGLRAEYLPDFGLLVVAGQHRVQAAKRARIPYLPVHVQCSDRKSLAAVRDACESEALRRAPSLGCVPAVHRELDRAFYPDRDVVTKRDPFVALTEPAKDGRPSRRGAFQPETAVRER